MAIADVISSSDPESIREIHKPGVLISIFETTIPENVIACLNQSKFHQTYEKPENRFEGMRAINFDMPENYQGHDMEVYYDHIKHLQTLFAQAVGEMPCARDTNLEMTPRGALPNVNYTHIDYADHWGIFAGVVVMNSGDKAVGGSFRYKDAHGLWHDAPNGSLITFQHQKKGDSIMKSPEHEATQTLNGCRFRCSWIVRAYE